MAERDHNEPKNENESRFQRFFLSRMKPGALPQGKAKEPAAVGAGNTHAVCATLLIPKSPRLAI